MMLELAKPPHVIHSLFPPQNSFSSCFLSLLQTLTFCGRFLLLYFFFFFCFPKTKWRATNLCEGQNNAENCQSELNFNAFDRLTLCANFFTTFYIILMRISWRKTHMKILTFYFFMRKIFVTIWQLCIQRVDRSLNSVTSPRSKLVSQLLKIVPNFKIIC